MIQLHSILRGTKRGDEYHFVSTAPGDDPEAKRKELIDFVVKYDLPKTLLTHPHLTERPKPHLDLYDKEGKRAWDFFLGRTPILHAPEKAGPPLRNSSNGKPKPQPEPEEHTEPKDRSTQLLTGDRLSSLVSLARERIETARKTTKAVTTKEGAGVFSCLCDTVEALTEAVVTLRREVRGTPLDQKCGTCDVYPRRGEFGWCDWGCRYIKNGPCDKWKERGR